MSAIQTTREQRQEAHKALSTLVRLFGDPCDVSEIRGVAGNLLEARVMLRNNQGERYVVHASNDDVCPGDAKGNGCTCGRKTGELAADWVKVGVVAHIPSVLANEKDSDS